MFRLDLIEQYTLNTSAGPLYQKQSENSCTIKSQIRAIAYYLPQFHAIPENDAWWGKGFTEWTNVTKALPRFQGHYQPQLPSDLGFYNLSAVDTLRRQADLARHYGIHGFCFHYYWFAGKTLLETPLNNLLATPDIDLPFCINWANESWSRRWDGEEKSLLIQQVHSPENDLAFAESILHLFRDSRYIRINNRPLLMLYRPSMLPDAALTIARWRDYFKSVGENPYIVMPQAFHDDDPRKYGMDAAVGFPPHAPVGLPPYDNGGWSMSPLKDRTQLFDRQFSGLVGHYDDMVERALSYNPKEFRLHPGVCPAWDNEARLPNRGNCFIGSTPEKYGRWLLEACKNAAEAETPDEQLVFINAWNEWAEGAHLEPDRHFGHAYLIETANALSQITLPVPGGSRRQTIPSPGQPAPLTLGLRVKSRFHRLTKRASIKTADAAVAFANWLRS